MQQETIYTQNIAFKFCVRIKFGKIQSSFFSGSSGNFAFSVKGKGLINVKMDVERKVILKGKI